MKLDDKVEKIKGYKWPGVIVADFLTTKGERRLVVECSVPEVAGALHIYAPEQLQVVDEQREFMTNDTVEKELLFAATQKSIDPVTRDLCGRAAEQLRRAISE